MPALFILAVISWLLGSGKTRRAKPGEPALFTALNPRPRQRSGPFFLSLAAHVCGLFLLFIASDIFSTPDDDFLPRLMASRSLLIKLPEHLYLAPSKGRSFPSNTHLARRARTTVRRKDLLKYAEDADSAALHALSKRLADATQSLMAMAPPALSPRAEPRKFELPDLPVKIAKTQTLLQADLPPDLPLPVDQRLPQLLFWDAERRNVKAPPEQPVQPGNLTARLETPILDATPRLDAPNFDLKTADVRVSSPLEPASSALTLPSATTMPLRLLDRNQQPAGPAAMDPFTGQPVHVLALSPDPAPLTDAFKSLFIPAGNQLARLPGASPIEGVTGLSKGADHPAAVGMAGQREPVAGRNSAAAAEAAPGPAASGVAAAELTANADLAAAADLAANGKPASNPAELVHTLPGGGQIMGLLTPPGLTGTPLKIVHPSNGVYDIVVVQSSATEAFPQGALALSGRPIYTVYLQVGAPKEWILQYCMPNAAGSVQTGNIVQLGNPAPIGAPYPLVTVRPPEDWRHGMDYLLVHGFLDDTGRFRDLKILPGVDRSAPSPNDLLQYLAYWEFRPAVQDGRPVTVEVILAVPPDRLEQAKI